MFTKLHKNLRNRQGIGEEPYYSDPVEVNETINYVLPEKMGVHYDYQSWSGYTPECTLEDKDTCKCVPVQTSNINVNGVYDDIECTNDDWMRMACEKALNSVENKGGPFGAVILQIDKESNQIIRYWKNHNQVTLCNDPTAHAEVMTIRSASKSLGVFNLGEIKREDSLLPQPGEISYCVIYSSAEPCPMCYSAICWANINALIFAATRYDAAVQGVNFSDEEIYEELSTEYPKRKLKVLHSMVDNSLDAFNYWKRSEKVDY